MLEKMDDFFTARVDGYDEHMKRNIEGAETFYKYTAALLPEEENSNVLDLGCNPTARVTGIDMTKAMLDSLKSKFPDKEITTICGSYFDVPFGVEVFDAAVSVESLHHFSKEEKIPLYTKLNYALKPGGYFILTDYFADDDEKEVFFRQEMKRIRKEQNLPDDAFYHFDTPLTVEHEKEALMAAGFKAVSVLENWQSTYTLKAEK